MKRVILFLWICVLSGLSWSQDQAPVDSILHQQFIPTAFGIKSRTIDAKDADSVLKAIEDFKIQNPEVVISSIDLQTCTSDYELPQNTITNRKLDEHVQLVQHRHQFVTENLMRKKLIVSGNPKVCGPAFSSSDLNDRFVTKESGAIFDKRFHALTSDSTFVNQLKEEALIDDPSTLKKLYPSLFLAKFKPFQGIRLFIKGVQKKAKPTIENNSTKPSGKIQ